MRRFCLAFSIAVVALIGPRLVHGQVIAAPQVVAPPTTDLLEQYRARALYTRFSFWKAQELFRAGKPVELGYFGGDATTAFAGSPAALDSMSTFRTLRIVGTAAYVTGLTLLVADIVLLATRSDLVIERNVQGEARSIKPLYLGLLLPGAVFGIGGGVMIQAANGYLSDAIDQYNSDLNVQLRVKSAPVGMALSPGLSLRGAF